MKRRGCDAAAARAGAAVVATGGTGTGHDPNTTLSSSTVAHARRSAASRRDHELRHIDTGMAGGNAVLDGELQTGVSAGKEPGIAFSSLGFFTQMYDQRSCIRFDGIYAWEAAPLDHEHWWRDVPVDMGARLHLYNVPARLDSARAPAAATHDGAGATQQQSTSSSSVGHPLSVLRAVARPEDFVALKVDIDGGPEVELVERIAQERALYELVDELFFEYHFYFDGLNFGWQTQRGGANYGRWGKYSVDDALSLMRRLRERGVRAHFWV